MAHDVFICYASEDKRVADAAVATLEARRIRCWIAPRDILPGRDYAPSILEGIAGAKVLVLVFSSWANASRHVAREVERAVNAGLPVLPFRTEAAEPAPALEYFMAGAHWLDALTPPLEGHLARLADVVAQLIGSDSLPISPATAPATALTPPPAESAPARRTPAPEPEGQPRRVLAVVVGAIALLVVVAIGVVAATSGDDGDRQSSTTTPGGGSTTAATASDADLFAADVEAIREIWQQQEDAWLDGPDAAVAAIMAAQYPGLGFDADDCRAAVWAGDDQPDSYIPADYTERYEIDETTIRRDDEWTMPAGALAGQRADGRVYVMAIDFTWSSAEQEPQTQTAPANAHVTILDGVTYKFQNCTGSDPTTSTTP